MAKKQLISSVYVVDDDGNGHWIHPGQTVPAWAAKKITNPAAWSDAPVPEDKPAPDAEPELDSQPDSSDAAADDAEHTTPDEASTETKPEIPKKTGAGSSKAAWIEYAKSQGFAVDDPENVKRDDIIAALADEGIPTE